MITVLEKLWKIAECRALSWSALALECIWPYGRQLWGYRKESRGEIILEKSQYKETQALWNGSDSILP